MHIRPVTRADVGLITPQVTLDSFMDDEIKEALSPHRREFPVDYSRSLAASARSRFVAKGIYGVVCVVDEDDAATGLTSTPGTLLGLAWWERIPTPAGYTGRRSAILNDDEARAAEAAALGHNTGPLAYLERTLLGIEDRYRSLVQPDRSSCPPERRAYLNSLLDLSVCYPALPGMWHLDLLAVHPSAQRRGIGARLMEWGIARAQAEGVPCILSASVDGCRLYEKYGFRPYSYIGIAFEANFKGGFAMVWDPWGIWTEPILEGEENTFRGRPITARIKGWSPKSQP